MNRYRPPYTTGQIATLLHVAPRTVTKWCDSGRLKCYRLPGSTDRRIREEDLKFFLLVNELPSLEKLEAGLRTGILSIG